MTQKQSPPSKTEQSEPESLLERMSKELDERLRASGLTVTLKEPSDTNEFVVTFPQGRRPKPTPKAKVGTAKPAPLK